MLNAKVFSEESISLAFTVAGRQQLTQFSLPLSIDRKTFVHPLYSAVSRVSSHDGQRKLTEVNN